MRLLITLVTILVSVAPVQSQNGEIFLFHATSHDPGTTDFYSCQADWTLLGGFAPQIYVHVYARLFGPTAGGISGAEFYIEGVEELVDQGFTASFVPNPSANAVFGNPVLPHEGDRRFNIAFASCVPGASQANEDLVFLTSIAIWRLTPDPPPDGVVLHVAAGNLPSNMNFPCALATLCDEPFFTKLCLYGGTFFINPPLPGEGPKDPTPVDGATGVPVDVVLSVHWTAPRDCTPTAHMFPIGFGTEPSPPLLHEAGGCSPHVPKRKCFNPGRLEPHTTYYWRAGQGPDWSFKTGDPLPVESSTWTHIKRLYR